MARRRRDVYVYRVHGVANPTTDNANFAAAVAALNASTVPMTILISGDLHLNGSHTITKTGRIKFIHNGQFVFLSGGVVTWGTDTVGYGSGTAISSVATPFLSRFTSASLSFSAGDYVCLIADNEVSGEHTEHTVGIEQRPSSLHRVIDTTGSNVYLTAEPIPDALTTSPRAVKLTMLKDVVIENLRYTWGGGASPTTNCMFFYQIAGLRLVNPRGVYPVPGGLWFDLCYDVTVEDPWIDAKYAPLPSVNDTNYGYNFIVGTCTRWRMLNGNIGMCRHGVTTTAGFTKATTNERYGTSWMCSIHGTEFSNPFGTTAFACIDNHAEGCGWVFDGLTCEVDTSATSEACAIFIRARRTVLRNSTIRGNVAATANRASGVFLSGPYADVSRNTFQDLLFGLQGYDFGGYNSERETITHNTFKDILGPGVYLARGTNTKVTQNEFQNCGGGGTYAGSTLRGCIVLELDSDAKIHGNIMPRYSNNWAIRVGGTTTFDARGNVCTGYDGASTYMFDQSSTSGPSLETSHAVAERNFVGT